MNRRQFVQGTAAALAAAALPGWAVTPRRKAMGVSHATYAIRWRSETESVSYPPFMDALDIIAHCRELGAGGVQLGIGSGEPGFAGKVRAACESMGLYFEGQVRLPQDGDDVARFEIDVARCKEAGGDVVRTACLGGRRYETFETAEAFETFKKQSYASLELAEPVVRKHRVKLAVENHKDWLVPDMLTLLDHLGSEWIGVTVDFGNSISLMEDPMEVVEAFAPYAFTTHIKDMMVDFYDEGFLLSEVPLGQGLLDLPAMVAVLERHNPDITFNLEMITRDPLQVPCLTDSYWATFEGVGGRELARTIRLVKSHAAGGNIPGVTGMTPEERLAFEEENNRRSFDYARETLGMV